MSAAPTRPSWLLVIRRYLLAAGLGNLAWEFLQMPLYTLWQTGTRREIISAGLHCSAGDLGMVAGALALALGLVGAPAWPAARLAPVLLITTGLGAAYLVYSEHLNAVVRHAWACTPAMPVLPGIGVGLAPLAQWLIVPPLVLLWAARPRAIGKHVIGAQ
ncbi:MAG: hypothetical protein M0002_18160 [Rhodospirillales bacterium]|nr:hypothetical protein [Rhodospirillales bacterium]